MTMKLLPSPSISSSSTPSFDTNMCTPSKSAAAGCLTAILRRFLRSRSLPTHPSDHITEASSLSCHSGHRECIKSREKSNAPAGAPGIVARLMGVDYFPLTSSADGPSPTISRTRALNSAEFTRGGDQIQRQITTVSFLENEKFFVLSFEGNGGGKSTRIRSKERKCEVGRGESKRKRRESCRQRREKMTNKMVLRVLNEAELSNRISEDNNIPEVKKFTRNRARLRRKSRKRDDLAYENDDTESSSSSSSSSSQDASPVSVLDFGQFIIDPEVPISEEDSTKSGDSNSRTALSAELDSHSHISQRIDDDSSIAHDLNSNKTGSESRRKANHPENYSNSWSRIRRMAKAEVAETSWICDTNCTSDELQELSKDFGLQILDELLKELVEEVQHLS